MTVTGLAARAAVSTSTLLRLMEDAGVVGGIYHMDYERAVVLTNDIWKRDCGGVPRGMFLIATTLRVEPQTAPDIEDEELILLRVEGSAPLPNQSELVATRMQAMREMTETLSPPEVILDNLTMGEMQWSALECRVLGTFYEGSGARSGSIEWGSDIDNLYSSARYMVYKPSSDSLSLIASYPTRTTPSDNPSGVLIGNVRYTSTTRRRAESPGSSDVNVFVNIEDFISMKTAVFGMTRAGKSNTMKIIATSVFQHSRELDLPIGQLIFDPAGEYANANQQDQTALRLLGDEWVVIYRFGATGIDPVVRPLQINFYDESQRQAAWDILSNALAPISDRAYIQSFLGAEFEDPSKDDFLTDADYYRACKRASRTRLALYALFAKADLRPPQRWQGITASMAGALADRVLADNPNSLEKLDRGFIRVRSKSGLKEVMDWIVEKARNNDPDANDWSRHESFSAIRAAYDFTGGRAVVSALRAISEFHNSISSRDHCLEIQAELEAGKIVIIDLSVGSETVAQALSERIVNHILRKANDRFRSNMEPARIQIFVEEAHRLFNREGFNQNRADPWVRLAKEAAKFKIGLVYATQEVTSVEDRVLSNTHNWIVAHLNSKKEIKQLSDYYDFSSFSDDILRSEDRGHVRLKTLSGKFIIPTQVTKFSHDFINWARASAGLPAITL